jgi:hypothetical protein
MSQREKKRGTATGRAATDERGHSAQWREKLVKIIGPNLVLGIITGNNHIGGAAVAPVEYHDPVAGVRERSRKRLHGGEVAPAAR